MFRDMMGHFGDDATGVHGVWTNAKGMSDNLESFNAGIQNLLSPEEAAMHTWTGKLAAEYGFTHAKIVKIVGSPGEYTDVEVLFTRG